MLDAAALPFVCGVGGNLQLKDRFAEAVRHLFGLWVSPVRVFRSLQQESVARRIRRRSRCEVCVIGVV